VHVVSASSQKASLCLIYLEIFGEGLAGFSDLQNLGGILGKLGPHLAK
jgi:hypothetical protein